MSQTSVPYHIDGGQFSLRGVADSVPTGTDYYGVEYDDFVLLYEEKSQEPIDKSQVSTTPESVAHALFVCSAQSIVDAASPLSNKSAEVEQFSATIQGVEWKQSVPAVASNIFSSLVVAHLLPNGNHRTALTFTEVYLRNTLGETVVTNVPSDEINALFIESKRLLTIRRNTQLFAELESRGVDVVERKYGVDIPLWEYDLGVSDPYSHYADSHFNLVVDAFSDLIPTTEQDPGYSVFKDRLRAGEDFTEDCSFFEELEEIAEQFSSLQD